MDQRRVLIESAKKVERKKINYEFESELIKVKEQMEKAESEYLDCGIHLKKIQSLIFEDIILLSTSADDYYSKKDYQNTMLVHDEIMKIFENNFEIFGVRHNDVESILAPNILDIVQNNLNKGLEVAREGFLHFCTYVDSNIDKKSKSEAIKLYLNSFFVSSYLRASVKRAA